MLKSETRLQDQPQTFVGDRPETQNNRGWKTASVVFSLFLFWMVFHVAPENAHVIIHDSLDSITPVYHVFAKSDCVFADSQTQFPALLGGIPRGCLFSELSLLLWPYFFLSPPWAFAVTVAAIRLTAFWGMWLLLSRPALAGNTRFVAFGVAAAFACLPFYPILGLTVAGQPWLLHAWLNIRDKKSLFISFLVLALFGLSSSLIAVGIFILPLLTIAAVIDGLRYRRIPWLSLAAVAVLTVSYALCEYRLISSTLFNTGYQSHRFEFGFSHHLTLVESLTRACKNFISGQYHTPSVHWPVLFIAFGIGLYVGIDQLRRARVAARQDAATPNADNESLRWQLTMLSVLMAAGALVSFWFGIYRWEFTGRLIGALHIDLLTATNLERIHYFHPLLWSLALAFALCIIATRARWGRNIVIGLLIWHGAALCQASHGWPHQDAITFREFYSPELFSEVEKHIGRPQDEYRVVSLGLDPAISLYNGFYTADGYWVNYPLEYKHRFRKVIAGELAKDNDLASYFDTWGSRCYLFSSELRKPFLYTKDHAKRRVDHLAINTTALWNLDCRYILSAVEIGNSNETGLRLERVFRQDDSPWEIFLYAVPRPDTVASFAPSESCSMKVARAPEITSTWQRSSAERP